MRVLRLAMLLWVALAGAAQAADPATLRIGYQKGSISLVLAKQHRLLEQRFANTRVEWIEFPAGPQMLEALNIGSLDIGSTGDIPPIFAQAAGADLLYIGAEPAKPQAEVILVPKDSPISAVGELKGKRIALQKGPARTTCCCVPWPRRGLEFAMFSRCTWHPPMPGRRSSGAVWMPGRSGTRSTRPSTWRVRRGCWPTAKGWG